MSGQYINHLCVDEFLVDLVGASATRAALDLGVIDHLKTNCSMRGASLAPSFDMSHRSCQLLLDLLAKNSVVEFNDDHYRLSNRFEQTLCYRDLLEAKLDFALHAAPDVARHFTQLLSHPTEFMKNSRIFQLFDYQKCLELTAENYESTKNWVRFTSTLTRYEAKYAMQNFDFAVHRRMLDVGGNSGEFALQVCRQNRRICGTILDLPVVCVVGEEHLQREKEADRISFVRGSAVEDALPTGFDLITFKSMLHDWPDEQAKLFLRKAKDALEPNGSILIFERGPIHASTDHLPFASLPMLLFYRSFREPEFYTSVLGELGFSNIRLTRFELEMGFFVISAGKVEH